jgi:hypothetical protein
MKTAGNLFQTLSQLRTLQMARLYQSQEQQKNNAATQLTNNKGPATSVTKPLQPNTAPNTTPATGQPETSKKPSKLDFQQMTRGQLSQWFEQAVAAGKIPKDQQTAFRVLLFNGKNSSTEQLKADNTPIDFADKAKAGLQSAIQRKDQSSMEFWAKALAVMKKYQGQPIAEVPEKPVVPEQNQLKPKT